MSQRRHKTNKRKIIDDDSDKESAELHWSLDPELSFSDWKLIVNKTTVYHVHKVVLAFGNHRSGYFRSLFRRSFAESQDSTSHIELDEKAASNMPRLLDVLYDTDEPDVTTDNAVVLLHLAKYFDVPSLIQHVQALIKQDLALDNCDCYYVRAALYHDTEILHTIATVVARNIHQVEADHPILEVSKGDTDFWMDVIKSARPIRDSQHLSLLVADVCREHPSLSYETFVALTERLPHLHAQAVQPLLQVHNRYESSHESLLDRCAASYSKHWHSIDWSNTSFLANQSPSFLQKLLRSSMQTAKNKVEQEQRLRVEAQEQATRLQERVDGFRRRRDRNYMSLSDDDDDLDTVDSGVRMEFVARPGHRRQDSSSTGSVASQASSNSSLRVDRI